MLFEGYNQIYFENDPFGMDSKKDSKEDDNSSKEPPEFKPLKKYYLIQKLYNLKNQLDDVNQNIEELDLILKFCNEMSYDTLLQLSNGIVDYIKTHLKGVANDNG